MAVLIQIKAKCLWEVEEALRPVTPRGWLQIQALSAQMRIPSQHANRCLIEETNCREITPLVVISPTALKQHISATLSVSRWIPPPLHPMGA